MWAKLEGLKTYLFNGAILVAALVGQLAHDLGGFDWRAVIPAEYYPYAVIAWAVANLVLRNISNTPPRPLPFVGAKRRAS